MKSIPPAGGFLSLGKLTARVETKGKAEGGRRRGRRSEIRNQKSEIPLSPSPFPLRCQDSHRHRHRPGHGVRRRSGPAGRHRVARVRRQGEGVPAGATGEAAGGDLPAGQTARCKHGKGIVVVPASAGNTTALSACCGPKRHGSSRSSTAPSWAPLSSRCRRGDTPSARGGRVPAAGQHPRPAIARLHPHRGHRLLRPRLRVRGDVPGPLAPPDPSRSHQIFFGIGDGVPNPNYYDEVTCGLVLDFVVDAGRVTCAVPPRRLDRGTVPDTTSWRTCTHGPLPPGRHRLRMVEAGQVAPVSRGRRLRGAVPRPTSSPPIDLPATMPLLNATNSRLLIGTGNCDTMTSASRNCRLAIPRPIERAGRRRTAGKRSSGGGDIPSERRCHNKQSSHTEVTRPLHGPSERLNAVPSSAADYRGKEPPMGSVCRCGANPVGIIESTKSANLC